MKERKFKISQAHQNLLVILLLAGMNAVLLYFTKQFQSLDGDFNAYTWGAKFSGVAEALKQGELRLWNPNIWCGVSGIHNFTDPFYPLAILTCRFFWNAQKEILSFRAYSFFSFIHSLAASSGFYFLLKEIGLSSIVCFLTVLIGTPLVIVNVSYMQLCWIPMFAYLFLKAYKEEKILNIFSVMAGIVFGMFLLQELAQGAVLGVVLAGIFYLTAVYVIACRDRRRKGIKKMTMLFLITGITGLCISAVNLFPILEQQNELLRVASEGFVNASEGVSLVNFYENPISLDRLREILGAKSETGWFGIITVIFCLMGIFAKKEYSVNPYEYLMLQFGKVLYVFIISASISCYFPEIFYYIPFLNMLRETYLYAGLHPFAAALLTAYGLDALYQYSIQKKDLSRLFYNVPLMFVLCSFILIQYAIKNYKNSSIWVLACAACAVLLLRVRIKNQVTYAVLLLIGLGSFLHLTQWCNSYNKWTISEAESQYEKVMDSYKRLQHYMDSVSEGEKNYRIMAWGGEKGVFSSNSMVDAGGCFTQGYWEPIYRKTLEMHWNMDLAKSVDLNNVLFFIIAENESKEYLEYLQSVLLDQKFEFAGTVDNIYPNYDAEEGQAINVYKNKEYKGDAWLVYDYAECSPETPVEKQFEILNDSSFLIDDMCLIETADKHVEDFLDNVTQPDENAGVRLLKYTNNSISLSCRTETAGILVMAESDAGGWKAYVDGREQSILTVNYGKRGLLIEPGEHHIRMVYAPAGYLLGRIITAAAFLLCFVLLIVITITNKFNVRRN